MVIVGFGRLMVEAIRRVGNPVVAGIDPRAESLPEGFLDAFEGTIGGRAEAFRVFGEEVVDVVAPMVSTVKLQAAFYEALGPSGMLALRDTVRYAREKGLIVILDGKRNDIGSTADAYARAYLGGVEIAGRSEEPWGADALTINPYLGSDGINPFLQAARGVVIDDDLVARLLLEIGHQRQHNLLEGPSGQNLDVGRGTRRHGGQA